MQTREQVLLGSLLIGVSLLALPFMVIMPEWQGAEKSGKAIKQQEQLLASTKKSITKMRVDIARIKKLAVVPLDVNVRPVEGGKVQQAVKAMLDDVITLARHYDNELVTLTPFNAMPPPKVNKPKRRNRRGAAPEPEVEEKPKVALPTVQKFGYDLSLRGTYPDIEEFVAVLSTHPELIEMQSIQFENAGGQTREKPENTNINNKPMTATLKLVLYLD